MDCCDFSARTIKSELFSVESKNASSRDSLPEFRPRLNADDTADLEQVTESLSASPSLERGC